MYGRVEGGIGGKEFSGEDLESKALKTGKLSATLLLTENCPLYNSVDNFPAFIESLLKKFSPNWISSAENFTSDPKLIFVILLISYFKLVRRHDPNSIEWRSLQHYRHPIPNRRSEGSSRCFQSSIDTRHYQPLPASLPI